jgi:hypothetical protein
VTTRVIKQNKTISPSEKSEADRHDLESTSFDAGFTDVLNNDGRRHCQIGHGCRGLTGMGHEE